MQSTNLSQIKAWVKAKTIIWLLVLWQLISVYLMAIGVWPYSFVWVNLGLSALFILFSDPYDSVLLLILSMPFYVAIPNARFDSFPTWRILFVVLFAVWFIRELRFGLTAFIKKIKAKLFLWDIAWIAFLLFALLSSVFARFRAQGLKQVIFLANVYLIYIVAAFVVNNTARIRQVLYYTALSLGVIVLIGYIQFIGTFFASQYYFWQYWASMISRLYYGAGLSGVLEYSNSWFSYQGNTPILRMFSIMPDSHSFSMVAALLMMYLVAMTCLYRKQKCDHKEEGKSLTRREYYVVWYAIRFAGLAIILSGTRGIWVGMLLPLLLAAYLYMKKLNRRVMKKLLVAFGLILLFFALTPAINYGLNLIRVGVFKDNFLDRARSIYDLREDSNVGRLIIWKNSVAYALHHPVGTGIGNFIVSLVPEIPQGASYNDVANAKNLRYNLPQKFVSAHSLYLHLLVELGILGLLIYLAYYWKFLQAAWRFFQKHMDDKNLYSVFIIAIAMTCLWFLGYGVFDITIFNDKVLIYFFISILLSGLMMRNYEQLKIESTCITCAPKG